MGRTLVFKLDGHETESLAVSSPLGDFWQIRQDFEPQFSHL